MQGVDNTFNNTSALKGTLRINRAPRGVTRNLATFKQDRTYDLTDLLYQVEC
jgi:hypothetical protein